MLGFIAFYITFTSFGQEQITEPKECANPSGGISLGGNLVPNPTLACLNNGSTSSKVTISSYSAPGGGMFTPGTVYFIFNYKDSKGVPVFPNTPRFDTTYTQAGTYWIMMKGKVGSKDYIRCQKVEVFSTPQPEIDYNACSANTVVVKILPSANNKLYTIMSINWGDGTTEEFPMASISSTGITATHTYKGAVIQPLIQGIHIRNNSRVCSGTPYPIPVGSANVPKITELTGLNSGAENKITISGGTVGQDYNIEIKPKGGSWGPANLTIKGTATSATANTSITGLNGANEYCFRLQQTGFCATPIYSNEVCTIKPASQILSPTTVKINWSSESPITRYEVPYEETPTGANKNTGYPNPSTATTYTYNLMYCKAKYKFNVIGYVGTGTNRVTIKSPDILVDPLTGGKLPMTSISYISNDVNFIRLTLSTTPQPPKYNIYRAEGNSTNFTLVKSVTTNKWDDYNVEPEKQQYCYKVDYEDECGNVSEQSPPFCSIFLTSKASNTLNWTEFKVSDAANLLLNVKPTQYTVQLLDDKGNIIMPVDKTVNLESNLKNVLDAALNDPNHNGRVTFRILAQQDTQVDIYPIGITDFPFFSYSNTYTFITPAQIFVPSAFTPNGDTNNDVFLAKEKFVSEFNMVIYNRWGQAIFESKDKEIGWDGNENGTPAPPGNYSYKIYGIDNAGQKFEKIGTVILIK